MRRKEQPSRFKEKVFRVFDGREKTFLRSD